MNEEDLFAAIIFGATIRLSAIIHDVATSIGLETPLLLATLMLAIILAMTDLWEDKHP